MVTQEATRWGRGINKIYHAHTLFSLLSFANLSSMSLICRILSSDAFCSGWEVQGHKLAQSMYGFTAKVVKSIVSAHRLVQRHVGRKPTPRLLNQCPTKRLLRLCWSNSRFCKQSANPVDAWMAEDCVKLGSVLCWRQNISVRCTWYKKYVSNYRQHLGDGREAYGHQPCWYAKNIRRAQCDRELW